MRKEHANLVSLLADHATFYLLDLPPNSKKPILLRTHLKISATVPYGTRFPDFVSGREKHTHRHQAKKHVLQESRLPNWCPSSMGGSTRQSRVHDRFSGALATTLLRTKPWAAVRFCWSYSFDVLGNPPSNFSYEMGRTWATVQIASQDFFVQTGGVVPPILYLESFCSWFLSNHHFHFVVVYVELVEASNIKSH